MSDKSIHARQCSPHYGKLRTIENPEAARIWRARFDEPEPSEPLPEGLFNPADPADPIALHVVVNAMRTLETKHVDVIYRRHYLGETLEEVAEAYRVTRERIRQREVKAIRLLLRAIRIGCEDKKRKAGIA